MACAKQSHVTFRPLLQTEASQVPVAQKLVEFNANIRVEATVSGYRESTKLPHCSEHAGALERQLTRKERQRLHMLPSMILSGPDATTALELKGLQCATIQDKMGLQQKKQKILDMFQIREKELEMRERELEMREKEAEEMASMASMGLAEDDSPLAASQ